MTRRNPLAKMTSSPNLAGDVLAAIKLTGVRKPRAYLSCECGRWWAGTERAIEDATAHVALYRFDKRHEVTMIWSSTCVIQARAKFAEWNR